jgi:hypothetical protein
LSRSSGVSGAGCGADSFGFLFIYGDLFQRSVRFAALSR